MKRMPASPKRRRWPPPLDLSRLKVRPLQERRSLTRIEDILVQPKDTPPECSPEARVRVEECAKRIRQARSNGASVMLLYGAHLLRNGAARIIEEFMAGG